MIDDDVKHGAIFLFNPSSVELNYSVHLNESLGLSCPPAAAPPLVLQLSLNGSSEADFLPSLLARVPCGELMRVTVPPTTALVVGLRPWKVPTGAPVLLGAPVNAVMWEPSGMMLTISGARGEAGTAAAITVALPPDAEHIATVVVNGLHSAFEFESALFGSPAVVITGVWGSAATRFARSQQLCPSAAIQGGVRWECNFTVPMAVQAQLVKRNQSFPLDYDLDPSSNNEPNVAWLAPGRLLVWVKYRSLLNDTLNASGAIDGHPLLVRKAYNTIVPSAGRYIGQFVDVTPHIRFGHLQTMSLTVPPTGGWTIQQGALHAGDDVMQLEGTTEEAQAACAKTDDCVGLTFRKLDGKDDCTAYSSATTGVVKAYLKSIASVNGDAAWCTFLKPPSPVGVFFDNVETLTTDQFTQPALAARA